MSKELQELQNKRAKLEEESVSLKNEQTNLEERVRVLEEKVAIDQLTKGNDTAREQISQLASKVDELEQRLSGKIPSPIKEAPPPQEVPALAEEPAPEPAETGEPEEPHEDIVTVAELEGPIAGQEEFGEESKRRSDRKKRKFF
jgi:chromosome segregation ATPase